MKQDITHIIRHKIKRMRGFVQDYAQKMDGKESNFTFHGGWSYGYHRGYLSALEDIADKLGIEIDSEKSS